MEGLYMLLKHHVHHTQVWYDWVEAFPYVVKCVHTWQMWTHLIYAI